MTTIIRRKQSDPISPESIERLKRLAEMPDSEINTTDIPEWTEEQYAAARATRELRRRGTVSQQHKKAS